MTEPAAVPSMEDLSAHRYIRREGQYGTCVCGCDVETHARVLWDSVTELRAQATYAAAQRQAIVADLMAPDACERLGQHQVCDHKMDEIERLKAQLTASEAAREQALQALREELDRI